MRFIDLFAGIGGIRLGFEMAGGKCVFSSELNHDARQIYQDNFGEMPSGDITKISANEIPNHDILVAGFPCQAFSIIGNKKGFDDARGTLFFEIARILKAKQPKAFMLENVKQLITHDKGKTFATIKSIIEELGYNIHYKILNGLDFGVPQKRERIIIVGFLKNIKFNFPCKIPLNYSLHDILESNEEINQKHYLSAQIREKIQLKLALQNKFIPDYPVIIHENKGGNLGIHRYSCALRANGSYNYLTVNGIRRLTPREMLRLQGFPESFKITISDNKMRQAIGNSVVVPKIHAVANQIFNSLNENKENTLRFAIQNPDLFYEKFHDRIA